MDIDLNSFRWEKGLGKLKMGSETRFSSVRSFQVIFASFFFFLDSSITTQQFNNHTSSLMTMHLFIEHKLQVAVEKIATNTLGLY